MLLDGMPRDVPATASAGADGSMPGNGWMDGFRRGVKRRLMAQLLEDQVKFEDAHARWAFLEMLYTREVLTYLRTLAALQLVGGSAIAQAEARSEEAKTAFEAEASRARARAQAARTRKLLQKVAAGEIDANGDPEMEAMVKMVQAAAKSGGLPEVFGSK